MSRRAWLSAVVVGLTAPFASADPPPRELLPVPRALTEVVPAAPAVPHPATTARHCQGVHVCPPPQAGRVVERLGLELHPCPSQTTPPADMIPVTAAMEFAFPNQQFITPKQYWNFLVEVFGEPAPAQPAPIPSAAPTGTGFRVGMGQPPSPAPLEFAFPLNRQEIDQARSFEFYVNLFGGPACPPPRHAVVTPTAFVPPPVVVVAAPPADTLAGTWVRERDGVQAVLRFAGRRLHLDVTYAVRSGKATRRGVVSFDADYAVSPDGLVFGVLTGAEVPTGVDTGDASGGLAKLAGDPSKAAGQLFRFRGRVDDGILTVGGLSVPSADEGCDLAAELAPLLCGRFQPADGTLPLPLPKAVKATAARAFMPLASPQYLKHYPQYFAPDPAFPLPRELASQTDPAGAGGVSPIPAAKE